MKTLRDYIKFGQVFEREKPDKDDAEEKQDMKPVEDDASKEKRELSAKEKQRGEIKFTIWNNRDEQSDWLNKGDKYRKIEYEHVDDKKNVEVDFLLGQRGDDWYLWVGKIGACSYDEQPYCDLKTKQFNTALINALDKVQELLDEIYKDPQNYIQFYKNK